MNQSEGMEQFLSWKSSIAIVILAILILAGFLGIYYVALDVPVHTTRVETQIGDASLFRGSSGNFLLTASIQNIGTETVSLSAQLQNQGFLVPNGTFSQPVINSGKTSTYFSDVPQVGQFDGSTGAVRVPNSQSLNSSMFSIEFGVQYHSYNPDHQMIVGKGAAGGNGWYFFSYRSANVFNDFVVYVNNTRYDQELGDIFAIDKWYDVALTLDGTTISAYVNGMPVQSWKRPITFVGNNYDLTIGNCVCGGYYLNGSLAFVRQYDRAMSAHDVERNFRNPSTPVGPGLVMWLSFDTETNGIFQDRSAMGNTGIAIGGLQLTPPVSPGGIYVVTIVARTSFGVQYSISKKVSAAG